MPQLPGLCFGNREYGTLDREHLWRPYCCIMWEGIVSKAQMWGRDDAVSAPRISPLLITLLSCKTMTEGWVRTEDSTQDPRWAVLEEAITAARGPQKLKCFHNASPDPSSFLQSFIKIWAFKVPLGRNTNWAVFSLHRSSLICTRTCSSHSPLHSLTGKWISVLDEGSGKTGASGKEHTG